MGVPVQRTKSGHIRKRRAIFPPIQKSKGCGHCINCLNPSRKQACAVRRQELLAALKEQSAACSPEQEADDAAPELQAS